MNPMGQQIIQQPDGRLAVFSSEVDGFIILDATPEELLNWRAEQAAERARRDTQRELDHVLAGDPRGVYFQFTRTWEEACRVHREHGHQKGEPA
jgi:hypothetical protein